MGGKCVGPLLQGVARSREGETPLNKKECECCAPETGQITRYFWSRPPLVGLISRGGNDYHKKAVWGMVLRQATLPAGHLFFFFSPFRRG